jgi:hypothetical protein
MDIYYVYQYVRQTNSKNGSAGTPYYVGKGKKRRAFQKHHRIKVPTYKNQIQIISKNLSESQAHLLEQHLIQKYGRVDLGTGCLHNLTNGGEGQSGRIPWNKGTKGLQVAWNKGKETPADVITKALQTKLENNTLNPHSPEADAKSIQTKKLNGTLNPYSPAAIKKQLETKFRKGLIKNLPCIL